MKKGNSGLALPMIAVLAFILAIFGQTFLCGLVFIFVLVVEKDEWLGRQTLQALLVSLVGNLFSGIGSTISVVGIGWSFFNGVIGTLVSVCGALIGLAVLVFSIIAIINCYHGKDATVPGIELIAYKAFGVQKPKPVPPTYQQPPMQYGQGGQPMYQQQGAQPVQQQPPIQQPIVSPVAPAEATTVAAPVETSPTAESPDVQTIPEQSTANTDN